MESGFSVGPFEILDAAALLQEARDRGHDQPSFPLVDPALRALKDHPVVERIAVRTKGE